MKSTSQARSGGAFRQLVLARLREIMRRPAAVFWVYVFPLITMVTLGVAFRNQNVERFQIVVGDSPAAADVQELIGGDVHFESDMVTTAEASRRLRTGAADLWINAEAGLAGQIEYHFDPTRPGSVLARNSVNRVIQKAGGQSQPVDVLDVPFDEPGGRYIDFLVPGLIGMGLMGSGLWGVGFAIVDLRIRKLLRLFMATPMRRSHFLGAMIVSRLIFTLPQIVILIVFSRWFFGVVNHGQWWLVGVLVLLGAIQFAGIGLLVASRAQTLETVSGLMNLIMLPMWIGSGIFFTTDRFPDVIQPVIQLLPLTPLIRSLRAVMQEGAGVFEIGMPLGLIALWASITFILALRWFRWN